MRTQKESIMGEQHQGAVCKLPCALCGKMQKLRAWHPHVLGRVFDFDFKQAPLEVWNHAGLCEPCGVMLYRCMSIVHYNLVRGIAPREVFVVGHYHQELAAALCTLYRFVAVRQFGDVTAAQAENARRMLQAHRSVVGEFVTIGHGNGNVGEDTTREAGPANAPTKASGDAKRAQQRIVTAAVGSAQTGAQMFAFPPRDHPNWGAMKRRPEKKGKGAADEGKGAGKQKKHQQRAYG